MKRNFRISALLSALLVGLLLIASDAYALKLSAAVRNARLDAIEATIGTSPVLEIRSGSAPAAITDADSGTLLASMTLPSDWMAAASSGSKALSGTWQDTSADATGTAAHWRLKSSGGTVHLQGTCGTSGAELNLSSTSLTAGQQVSVTSFSLADGNP